MKPPPQSRRCDKTVTVRGVRRQCRNSVVQRYLGKWRTRHACRGRL